MTVGIIGCGFWAGYQVAAWREADPTLQFAFCDRNPDAARQLAQRFNSAAHYGSAEVMLAVGTLDAVDIITGPDTHADLTALAAGHGLPVISQKPMAPDEETAARMVVGCREHNVPLYVHENFRWQAPIRHLKSVLSAGTIGRPFRARLSFKSAFPVFDNQPSLALLDRFILADLGVHLLDVCRFLFGEVEHVYCLTNRVNPAIRGEDVATVLMKMVSGLSCTLELSYATVTDLECFPQTLAEIEGAEGSVRLLPGYKLVTTTRKGTERTTVQLPAYDWVHPQYAVVQSSMVAIHRNFLAGLRTGAAVETSGEDNLRTLALLYAAYRSADEQRLVHLPDPPTTATAHAR